ncbi:MAG: hypothetical protein ACFFCH_03985 [Promethearchaeota archaeon]
MSEKTKETAYYELYCKECPSNTGVIADLARNLRKEFRTYRYDMIGKDLAKDSFFKDFQNGPEAYKDLGGRVCMRYKNQCKGGCGPPFSKMKKCAQKKGFEGCRELSEFKIYKHFEFFDPAHGDVHHKNLSILKKKGVDGFLAGKKHWWVTPKKKVKSW